MGIDDLKILGVAGAVATPFLAQVAATAGDFPGWLVGLKELGSVVAVIYLFHYVLTRALPQMQDRFESTYRAQSEAHAKQLDEERRRSSELQERLLTVLIDRLPKSGK